MDFKVTTEFVNSHNYAQWRLKGLSTLSVRLQKQEKQIDLPSLGFP